MSTTLDLRQVATIVRNDVRLIRADPFPLILVTAMPAVLMIFLKPVYGPALNQTVAGRFNGAEQAVPGLAIMFAFLVVANTGFSVFREHGWGTWQRYPMEPASRATVVVGKALTPVMWSSTHLALIFLAGYLFVDLRATGSWVAVAAVSVALALTLVSLAFALVAVCRSMMQMNALANLMAVFLAGLGGALVPFSIMPGWARAIAPATPPYWAMRGYNKVFLYGGGLADVGPTLIALAGFSAVFTAVTVTRFRLHTRKLSWT